MNNPTTNKLRGAVELLLDNASRINLAKPVKYWHPLAMATYGVDEIMEALDSLCSFRTTMWEKTAAFEQAFAAWQGCRYAVMVNSGSSADLLLAFAVKEELRERNEILVPVLTWPTHIWSAMMAGFKVKMVDVNPLTLNATIVNLKSALTEKTGAISLVHLMGLPCQMDEIMAFAKENNLIVLEDCCEALGSTFNGKKVGNFGLASTFSFFFAHHMTTMEGGIVCTDDDDLNHRLRVLRSHGWMRNVNPYYEQLTGYDDLDPRYTFTNWGFNVRPTELQASFGLHQLPRIDDWQKVRHVLAEVFYLNLSYCDLFTRPAKCHGSEVSWFALPVLIRKYDGPFTKSRFTDYLEQNGVETRPIVCGNVARHPVAQRFPELSGHFPGADIVHRQGFYIGLSPLTPPTNIDRLSKLFFDFKP